MAKIIAIGSGLAGMVGTKKSKKFTKINGMIGSPIASIYSPSMPQWLKKLREETRRWIDTHCGLSNAMRGHSEQFQSASQLIQRYELYMRRYNDLWRPKLQVIDPHSYYVDPMNRKPTSYEQMPFTKINGTASVETLAKLWKDKLDWSGIFIDEPIPSWMYNENHKHWYKSVPIKKENKMKKWKFFKAIRMQTQKLETVVSALKWFGLIKWDEWDEKYYTIKPNGIPEQNVSMRLCNIAKFVHNAKLKLDDLPIRENQLEERMTEVELKEKAVDENTENIKSLVDYFFVDDYFDGKDSAPYSGVKFGNKILKETAETFEMIDSNPMRLGNLLNFSNFNKSTWKYIKTCYTSGDNALEHKATIARYEKEVANYRKNLKRRSK